MSQYLTEEEIAKYCTSQAGVTVADVVIASDLIDAYCQRTFSVNTAKETIKINRKSRGKLHYSPVIDITSVSEIVRSPFGLSRTDTDITYIDLDIEQDGYFTYLAPYSVFGLEFYHMRDRVIEVVYRYGYEAVPDDIKYVTAMLAQNIRQFNTYAGFKKLSTLDYTIELGNPSFFTDDMRSILDKYKVV